MMLSRALCISRFYSCVCRFRLCCCCISRYYCSCCFCFCGLNKGARTTRQQRATDCDAITALGLGNSAAGEGTGGAADAAAPITVSTRQEFQQPLHASEVLAMPLLLCGAQNAAAELAAGKEHLGGSHCTAETTTEAAAVCAVAVSAACKLHSSLNDVHADEGLLCDSARLILAVYVHFGFLHHRQEHQKQQ